MFRLFSRKKANPKLDLAGMNLRMRKASSHRKPRKPLGKSLRPPGPYRPQRLPRLTKNRGLGVFLTGVFLIIVAFSLAYTWKAQQMAYLLAHLDAARTHQQELRERLKSLQLIEQESTSYSRIEPLAREKLGMLPLDTLPIVIAVLDERVAAMPPQDNKDYLASNKEQEK
jgi:cell division protein FtsL